jgi:hypothetical protein
MSCQDADRFWAAELDADDHALLDETFERDRDYLRTDAE